MKTIGLARLGRDAELRYAPSGDAVCNLSLAVSYGKKAEGEQYRPTQWIEASLWGKRAESLAPFLLKNTVHCFTLSDAHIETYRKNDGGEGIKMVATVLDIELGPNDRAGQPQAPAAAAQRPASAPQSRGAPTQQDMDDDIPFN